MSNIKYDGNKITIEIDVSDLDKKSKWLLDCGIQYGATLKCGHNVYSISLGLSPEDRKATESRVENNAPTFRRSPRPYRR